MILGISGKKQAGKDTLAQWLIARADILFPGKRVRRYGFADEVKRIAFEVFRVPYSLLNGTEEDKNTEARPGFTVRDVCKKIGNGFREIDPRVWVDATLSRIESADRGNLIAIIADVRFPDEVTAIQQQGGKVIRLLRGLPDADISETALDGYTGFDAVIDNRDMSIAVANATAAKYIREWGFF